MSHPLVVHVKYSNLAPSEYVYVGRGVDSDWGNPFVLWRDGSRATVIQKHRAWLMDRPKLVYRAQLELRGRRLACWCAPLPCHADTLAELANAPVPVRVSCPHCAEPHVDEGEFAERWHRVHQCQACRVEWMPYEYYTVGVR